MKSYQTIEKNGKTYAPGDDLPDFGDQMDDLKARGIIVDDDEYDNGEAPLLGESSAGNEVNLPEASPGDSVETGGEASVGERAGTTKRGKR